MQKILLAFFIFLSVTAPAQWQQTNGPFGGTVRAVAVSGNTVFAGTHEGLYRSTNNGSTWALKINGMTSSLGASFKPLILSLAANGSSVFAGTAVDGIFLSVDNGENWTQINNGLPAVNDINAIVISGSNVYAATNDDGVFLSSDNGSNWTAINNGLTSTNVLSLAVSGNTIFAGTAGGVFRSTDNGGNWTKKSTGYIQFITINGNNIFAGGAGVNVSVNNGDNWTPVNNGLTNTTVNCMAVNGGNIFVGTNGGVFLSANNGANWTAVSNGITDPFIMSMAIGNNIIFAGTWSGGGVYATVNDGANWIPAVQGLQRATVNAVVTNGSTIYACTLFGLYVSVNEGTSWRRIHIPVSPYTDVRNLFINNNNLFASNSGGIFHSSDNGDTWSLRNTGLANTSINSIILSGTNLFAATQAQQAGGGVYLSVNNGSSWTIKNNGLTNTNVFGLLSNANKLFAATDGGLFVSTDNANSWTAVTNGVPASRISFVGTITGNTLVATVGIGGGQSYISTDNGNSWTSVNNMNNGLSGVRIGSLAGNGNLVYAATTHGIYFSSNSGTCWTAVNEGLPDTGVSRASFVARNANFLYAVQYVSGIWKRPLSQFTSTCGTTPTSIQNFNGRADGSRNILSWQTASEQNTSYFSIERSADGRSFSSIGKVTAAGSSTSPRMYGFTDSYPIKGDNYYRLKLVLKDGSSSFSEVIKVFNSTCSMSVSPNPARSGGNITISCAGDCLKIQLLSASGCLIKQWYNFSFKSFKNQITLRLPCVRKGVYYLKCISKKESKTIKLIIQ